MDKSVEKVLVAGVDVQRNRVEIAVMGWARVGYTACYVDVRLRKFGWIGPRSVRPSTSRPWLRQNKGRGAQL